MDTNLFTILVNLKEDVKNILGGNVDISILPINAVEDKSGLYLIFSPLSDGKYKTLDIGESGELQTRLKNHDRRDQWEHEKTGDMHALIIYCDEETRMAYEKKLRNAMNPACGER